MVSDLVAGVLAGLAVAMPIGAIGSYLVGLAARERFAVAAGAALGIASVDGGYAVVAALGGAGLSVFVGRIAGVLTMVAAVVLIVMAARTLQTAVHRYRSGVAAASGPSRLTPRRAYFTLIAMTAVNPATVITFAAVVLGRSAGGDSTGSATILLFAVGAFAASAVWQLLLAGGGSLLGRLISGRRGQLGIGVTSALVMLGLAVGILAH